MSTLLNLTLMFYFEPSPLMRVKNAVETGGSVSGEGRHRIYYFRRSRLSSGAADRHALQIRLGKGIPNWQQIVGMKCRLGNAGGVKKNGRSGKPKFLIFRLSFAP